MELCDGTRGSHEAVVHEDGDCPVCNLLQVRDDAKNEVDGVILRIENELDVVEKILDDGDITDVHDPKEWVTARKTALSKMLSTLEGIEWEE